MTTLTDQPPETASDHWTAALKFHAAGYTAAEFRSGAASEHYTARIAAQAGITPAEVRRALLDIARALDSYTAEGLTREGAFFLASLDKRFASFAEFDASARDLTAA